MTKDLVIAELDPEFIPQNLQNDDYYPLNDHFVKQECKVRAEIVKTQELLEPWEAEFARRFANGESINHLQKELRKTRKTLNATRDKLMVRQLTHYWQHLKVLQDGPNEIQRKQMLWRIAVDNEKEDPKEATKALAELNRMEDSRKGVGGNGEIKIVINNQLMNRGKLDG